MEIEQIMIVHVRAPELPADPENECEHCDDPMTCGNRGKYLTDIQWVHAHRTLGAGYIAQFAVALHRQEQALREREIQPTEVLVPLCAPILRGVTCMGRPVIKSSTVRTPTLQRSETYTYE